MREELENKLNEFLLHKTSKENEIQGQVAALNELIDKITEAREQIDIYAAQKRELKRSKVCSLREYREARMHLWLSKNHLLNLQFLLKNSEQALKESRVKLTAIEKVVSDLNTGLARYGHLYRFPSDYGRSATSN